VEVIENMALLGPTCLSDSSVAGDALTSSLVSCWPAGCDACYFFLLKHSFGFLVHNC
jgi:hypothetical protein